MTNPQYLYQPKEVALETLALCNARCGFCPYETLDRKGTEMPIELITDLIDQMAQWEYPFFFSPFKVNEPFLDSRLFPILRYVNEVAPKARLRLFTNGSRLDMGTAFELATLTNVAHVWVSLNSHDKGEHERTMGFKQYNTIMHNLDNLHRQADGFPHRVIVSRVAYGNAEDIEFIEFCRERWPRWQAQLIKRDGWLGYTSPQLSTVPQSPCARWWEMSITASGDAALCCMDGSGEFKVGNVRDSTLYQIYNQPMLLRRRLGTDRRSGCAPCNRCTY